MVRLHSDLQGREFDFDDIIMEPYRLPDFSRDEVDLTSHVTRDIEVKTPFLGAPMDTVTDHRMAIMLGLLGGVGVIHYNFPTVDEQIKELQRVKNYKAAFVLDPSCLRSDSTVEDVQRLHDEHGFYSVPITEDGTPHTRLIGFVSHRDVRYESENPQKRLQDVMTRRKKLIVAHRRDTLDKGDIKYVNNIIKRKKLDKLIIVDDEDRPCAIVTDRDIELHRRYPLASVDDNKQLYGFMAIGGAWHDPKKREIEMDRIDRAAKAGVDCLVIDQGVVYASQLEIAKYIKTKYPEIQVGVGNVASGDLVKELLESAGKYIDMIKFGVGPGGACITQQELGVGRMQAVAVHECGQVLMQMRDKYGHIAGVADGGVRSAADITKMLAFTDAVMMGQLFAGLDESPPPAEHRDGRLKKKYRGMGSIEAMQAGGEIRYGIDSQRIKVPEGIVKWVDYLGPGEPYVAGLIEAVKQSMNKQGFRSVVEMQEHCSINPYHRRD